MAITAILALMRRRSNRSEKRPLQPDTAPVRPEIDAEGPRTRQGRIRLRSIDDLDGRTAAARRARELVEALETDLGGDPTTGERELIKRAALLGAITEDCEVRWLERRPADLTLYGTLVDRQRRILEALGLRRRPRDVTPDQTPQILDHIREAARNA